MAVLERRVRDCKETSPFLAFAKNVTSQGGEDGVIAELFRHLGVSQANINGVGYCIDIGAWDGKHWSNTYTLLNDMRWGGMLIEADPERAQGLKQLYAGRPEICCCDCLVELSGPNALTKFLSLYQVSPDFDFLSIDVDGADYHLWKSLGDEFTPRVVCIEFNPSIPNHIYFVQEDNIQIQQGSSLLALTELAKDLAPSKGGYQLVCTTTFNAFFVRRDLMHLLPATTCDYSIHSLHSAAMVTDMFQTYDGQLKLSGPQKLLWHRNAINPQKIQPLTKKQQIYPFAPPIDTQYLLVEQHIDASVVLLSEALHGGGGGGGEDEALCERLGASLASLRAIFEVPEGHNQGKSRTFFFDAEALSMSVLLSCRMVALLREGGGDGGDVRGAVSAHLIDRVVFGHAVSVSDILTNKGDRELLNDAALAASIYKQALHVLVAALVQDKCACFPYRQHMLAVSTRLGRCVSTKNTDHMFESVFWLYFSKLVHNSCSSSDEASSTTDIDLCQLVSKWRSKISSKLISMGVSKDKINRSHLTETTIFGSVPDGGLPSKKHGDEEDRNNLYIDEEVCTLLSRTEGRKLARILRNERSHAEDLKSQHEKDRQQQKTQEGGGTDAAEVARLQRENIFFKISTIVLLGAACACVIKGTWIKTARA